MDLATHGNEFIEKGADFRTLLRASGQVNELASNPLNLPA
jgi:hypothetical protein